MEKVLIIGSNGQLGSDIKNEISKSFEICTLEHKDFMVENQEQVNLKLTELKPAYVINTSAFHNTGACETNPQQAFLINATAVKYLSEACNKINATLVHFSTDYVFGADLTRKTPYLEEDTPGPVQMYGVSKLAGEKVISNYCQKYFCLRTSGLYGLKGTAAKKYPNFVEMMVDLGKKALEKGEKMPSAQDQVLIFNPTAVIAKAVHQLLKTTEYGLYHVVCNGFSSRMDFVKALFKYLDIKVDVFGVDSDYFKPTYAQPKFSALNNLKLQNLNIKMPLWNDALKSYLVERENYLKTKLVN